MHRAGFLVIMLVACGDQEQQIIVNVYMQTPALVTVNTDGTWRTPEQTGPQQYGFATDGDYKFIAACDNADGTFFVGEVVGRPDPEILGWNIVGATTSNSTGCNYGISDASFVDIAGTISEHALVSSYGFGALSAPNPATWDYVLRVPPGVHDLFASNSFISNDFHVVRRRGVDMRTNSVQPPIDLAGESLPMLEPTIPVDGTADSMTTLVTLYVSDPGAIDVSIRLDTSSFTVIDPASLDPGDEQLLRIDANATALGGVSAEATFSADLGPIELPPAVDAKFYEAPDGLFAHWGTLPDFSYMTIQLSQPMEASTVFVISQKDYALAQGQIAFEAPPDFPARWLPSWTHQLVGSSREFSVHSSDASWYYTTSVFSENDDKSDATGRRSRVGDHWPSHSSNRFRSIVR